MSAISDVTSAVRRLQNGEAPIPYVPPGVQLLGGLFGGGGRTQQLESMGFLGTIFSIVDGIATDGAQLDWHLMRKPRPGADPDAPHVEVYRHVLLDLLNANPHFSWQEIVEISLQHLNLVGESWWIIARSSLSTMPLELWPVRPDRMEPVPSARDFLAGYVYFSPGGQRIPFDVDEVIFIRRPNPLDPYRGLGPVQSVLVDVDASRYTAEWNRNFFLNSAEPGGIVKTGRKLSDAEFRRLRSRWEEQHSGVSRAHRVAILEEGEWIDRKFTMRDMQFKELRDVNHEIIRRAWRWPSSMLGDSGHVNRATAQADEYMVGRHIINPQMRRLIGGADRLTGMFFPSSDPDVYWRVDSASPEDEEAENAERSSRTTAWAALVGAGGDPVWAAEVAGLPAPPAMPAPPVPALPGGPAPGNRPRRGSECPGCGLHDGW